VLTGAAHVGASSELLSPVLAGLGVVDRFDGECFEPLVHSLGTLVDVADDDANCLLVCDPGRDSRALAEKCRRQISNGEHQSGDKPRVLAAAIKAIDGGLSSKMVPAKGASRSLRC
jgi:hypothetical protein